MSAMEAQVQQQSNTEEAQQAEAYTLDRLQVGKYLSKHGYAALTTCCHLTASLHRSLEWLLLISRS